MRINSICLAALVCLTVAAFPVQAKKWTIYERQVQLVKEINAGVKSNDLTADQAESLKKEEAKISEKIEKMKEKNAGKLSVEDQNNIEKQLNKLSLRIQKLKLEKRVQ